MHDVSTFRLTLLRAMYLLIFVGLATQIWPLLINPPTDLPLMKGVVRSMLATVSLLAALGLRYPLAMLPVLFFELVWKTIWVVLFGLPLWLGNEMDAATQETWQSTLMGAIILPVIPWRYAWARYAKAPADRWRSAT